MLRTLATIFLTITTSMTTLSQEMIVHLKDGKQISYLINDVDSVELKTPSNGDEQPYGTTLTGTEGNAIDLGLSVKWADHNLGASDASENGTSLAYSDVSAKAAVWGNDWHLPTEAEWQELYDNCTWSWTIRNGIGGRVITAKNGNSIFIPAAGVSFDDQIYIRGCIGIYWTADKETPTTNTNAPLSAIGTYFDSANIFRMSYPMINKFTVRLVKK